MADKRTFTSGRFILNVGDYRVAYLKKFDGLAMEADIATADLGADNFQAKHVANIKWTPGKATIGAGMGLGMAKWIKKSFDKSYEYQEGSLISADFDYKAQSELTFSQALITGVTIPAFDGSSKDAVWLDVEFDAEQVRWAKGDGKVIGGDYGHKTKSWLASNFRFKMGALPCDRVSKVDSMQWKCSVTQDQIGIHREPTKHPAKVTVPDIKCSVSYADVDAWHEAGKKWFIDGFHAGADEIEGGLAILGPNMKDVVGEFEFLRCGFKKFASDAREANSEKPQRLNVEFYCEALKFDMKFTDA
jgi:hypothetical protein